MSESRHTQLPWRRLPHGDSNGRYRVFGPPHPVDGGHYAPLCEFYREADAKLVLVAVNAYMDLLEALEDITDQLERVGDNRKDAPFIAAARAAIAKAKGEQ